MKNRTSKAVYLMRHQKGMCWISGKPLTASYSMGMKIPIEIHHRFHNTKTNCKVAPLFINSMLNLVLVLKTEHEMKRSAGIITSYRAERINEFLSRNKTICDFVNGEFSAWEIDDLDNPIEV